jgi:hypothetical protein
MVHRTPHTFAYYIFVSELARTSQEEFTTIAAFEVIPVIVV